MKSKENKFVYTKGKMLLQVIKPLRKSTFEKDFPTLTKNAKNTWQVFFLWYNSTRLVEKTTTLNLLRD